MLRMSYEVARALRELLGRIDDDEDGVLLIRKQGLGADLTVDFADGRFEISGGGTTERVDGLPDKRLDELPAELRGSDPSVVDHGPDFEPSPDPYWMND